MRVIPFERKVDVINGLCNGMSLRAASRVFNTHRTAIQNLLVRVGANCDRIMAETMKEVDCKYLEIDEIWTFCGKKSYRLTPKEKLNPELGDFFVFYAIDNQTKLVPAWTLGKRTSETSLEFLLKLRGCLNGNRPQITTDGWRGYNDTMFEAFGGQIDYAQLVKRFEADAIGPGRYAPPRVSEVVSTVMAGSPNPAKVCTSIVERANLSLRTMQRRFTRLALGFSRKLENLKAATSLHFGYYNLVWQPRTLKGLSPALAAGVTDRLWDVADLVEGC